MQIEYFKHINDINCNILWQYESHFVRNKTPINSVGLEKRRKGRENVVNIQNPKVQINSQVYYFIHACIFFLLLLTTLWKNVV